MVIEHTFVTTLEAPQTMQTAMQFLASRGFAQSGAGAFAVGQEWNTLEMRRGKKKAAKAKSICDLPQVAHVQWDRGRVVVALSIEPSHVWGGSNTLGWQIGTANENPKKMAQHARMLSAIASALEQVLVRGVAPDLAMQPWMAVEAQCMELARKRKIRNVIIVLTFCLLIGGLVALAVYSGK